MMLMMLPGVAAMETMAGPKPPKLVSKHPRRPEGRAGVAGVAFTPRGISFSSFDCRVAGLDVN